MACWCFPYGAILLSGVYAIFCFCVLEFGSDCPDTECRTEGVDNAPISYFSNFFIAGIFFFLGMHAMYIRDGLWKAQIAFASWSIAHSFWGIIGLHFGNDGTFDGKAHRAYFFLNLLAYFFSTVAIFDFMALAMRLWPTLLEEYQPMICAKSMIRCLLFTLAIILFMIMGGCLWCGLTPDVWVSSALDEFPNDISLEVHQCIQLVDVSQVLYVAISTLLLVAIASIYGASAKQQIEELDRWYYVCGMPTPLAAAAVAGFQTTIFVFYLIAYLIQRGTQTDPDKSVQTAGSIGYYYSVLMTGYFLHNLVSSMSLKKHTKTHQINKRRRDSGHLSGKNEKAEMDESDSNMSIASNQLYKQIKVLPSSHYLNKESAEESPITATRCSDDDTEHRADTSLQGSMTDEVTAYEASLLSSMKSESLDLEQGFEEPVKSSAAHTSIAKASMPLIEPTRFSVLEEADMMLPQNSAVPSDTALASSNLAITRAQTNDLVSSTSTTDQYLCGLTSPWSTPPVEGKIEEEQSHKELLRTSSRSSINQNESVQDDRSPEESTNIYRETRNDDMYEDDTNDVNPDDRHCTETTSSPFGIFEWATAMLFEQGSTSSAVDLSGAKTTERGNDITGTTDMPLINDSKADYTATSASSMPMDLSNADRNPTTTELTDRRTHSDPINFKETMDVPLPLPLLLPKESPLLFDDQKKNKVVMNSSDNLRVQPLKERVQSVEEVPKTTVCIGKDEISVITTESTKEKARSEHIVYAPHRTATPRTQKVIVNGSSGVGPSIHSTKQEGREATMAKPVFSKSVKGPSSSLLSGPRTILHDSEDDHESDSFGDDDEYMAQVDYCGQKLDPLQEHNRHNTTVKSKISNSDVDEECSYFDQRDDVGGGLEIIGLV